MPDKAPPKAPAPTDEERASTPPSPGLREALAARGSANSGRNGPEGARPADAREPAPAPRAAADQHPAAPTHPGVALSPPDVVPESDVRLHSPAAATPPPAQDTGENLGELPWAYGDGRLVALVRDPVTLFVYWDLSQQQIEQAFEELGPSRAVLRLWNPRQSNELVRETDVRLDARAWYVRELPAGTELRAELWAVGERGSRLLRAARPVRLPPQLPSDQLEAFYLRLELDQPLPRDGVAGSRALSVAPGPPSGWERRMEQRHQGVNRSSSRMPWSATNVRGPDDEEDTQ